MNENIETTFEALITQARETSELPDGSPLRSARMAMEHRQLHLEGAKFLEYHRGCMSVHEHLTRLVKKLLAAFSAGSNGLKFWIADIPLKAKTALVLLNVFMRSK